MAVVVLMAALALTTVPAAAHTPLLQASPGPGQQAGGVLDFIDLAFLSPVTDSVVEVTQNGVAVPGVTEVPDGTIIRFAFTDPLSVPGRYDVAYTTTSADLDRVTEVYFFTYEPDSPQAFRIGETPPAPDSGGWNQTRIVGSLVLVGALCAVAFVYLSSLERRRTVATPNDQPLDR